MIFTTIWLLNLFSLLGSSASSSVDANSFGCVVVAAAAAAAVVVAAAVVFAVVVAVAVVAVAAVVAATVVAVVAFVVVVVLSVYLTLNFVTYSLTLVPSFWRRNFFFILAHPVYKM